ncbi:MAG: LAGLIDADG family homing endonuclease, partial [Patescibacteria group bacterium]|nr:LAGLIDADG family homing endonuclease [Patescibacteria group bacterium]
MLKSISSTEKSYLAGFLDADGSIYVQAKPNETYRFGFQIAPYIVFYQSSKDAESFSRVCSLIQVGHKRLRKDGIVEYIISKQEEI